MPEQDSPRRGSQQAPSSFLPRGLAHHLPSTDGMLTRGSALQGLITSRSGTNLTSLGRGARGSVDLEYGWSESEDELPGLQRRQSHFGVEALATPQMRSMRLIGNSNPRYRWDRYVKTDDELKEYSKPL